MRGSQSRNDHREGYEEEFIQDKRVQFLSATCSSRQAGPIPSSHSPWSIQFLYFFLTICLFTRGMAAPSQEASGPRQAADASSQVINGPPSEMVWVKSGAFVPLFKDSQDPDTLSVSGFYLDKVPVTNKQFYHFTLRHPKWSAANVTKLFADSMYLKTWKRGKPTNQWEQPVVNVSWFAARAYCGEQGKRLPGVVEWEYAAAASSDAPNGWEDPDYRKKVMTWYSNPTPAVFKEVGQSSPNYYGVQDMVGLVWEWVSDFNTAMVTGESRGDTGLERNLFCGSASVGAPDPTNYAAFMRYAFRSSLQASYTASNLGFRCAKDGEEKL